MGFEPTAPSLGSWYSTTELRPLIVCLTGLYLSKLYHASIIASVCFLYIGHRGERPSSLIQLTFVVRQDLVHILHPGMNCDVLIRW